MSTTDIAPDTVANATLTESSVTTREPGATAALAMWITSSDSKVIGRTFVGASFLALVACAVLGVLLGLERVDGSDTLLDASAIPQMFAAFRIGLVWGVMIPFLLGVAIAIVPLQVGARSLAFPRLALAGFWAWFAGLVLVVISLAANGGPGGGDADFVDLFLAAHGLLVCGLAAAAVSVATTVLATRAPGLRMSRVPFFAWSAMIASIGLLLVLPVVLGVLIYLYVDHHNARALFGGNVGIGSWIGFALTQPATYLFAVPAVGLTAELVPVTFRKRMPLRVAVYTGISLVGIAALSAVTQQADHDLPWSGSGLSVDDFGNKFDDMLPYALFTLVPILGVVMVMFLGAVAARPASDAEAWVRPRITAAFVFAFFGLGMLLVGMLGGALVPITDLGLQGTVFEEGVVVYVAYGTALAGLGAVAYWSPKWTGKLIPDKPLFGLATLGMVATVLAALPYYVAGFADQPAASGVYDYDGPSGLWNTLVTIGHALMAVVVLAFIGLWLRSSRSSGDDAGDDPWGGQTLEWLTTSPAPTDNFLEVPTVMSPEPVLDLLGAEHADRGRSAR
ncbi:MAG: cbb3-type cytochrome c oxidase subunit I [Ilumatobacteraceae bacterium]